MNMLINGSFTPSSTGAVIKVTNPYTGQVLDTVPAASSEDVERAVSSAADAFAGWARTPVFDRAILARRFLELVEEHREELAVTLSLESGKKIAQSRIEVNNILLSWNLFIEKARHIYGTLLPAGAEANQAHNLVWYQRVPLGVIACILPFNFPCNLFSQKTAPALLAGNCVILKPATDNPLTILKLGALLKEAGFPDGTIQVLTGRGSDLGTLLAAHPGIHAISLTGSSQVGIQVAKTAASTLKKVMLELGGNDPFIVLPDADLDLAVREAVTARFFYSGQICCAPKRYLVHQEVYEEFLEKLTKAVSVIRCTDPMTEDGNMGTLISENAAQKVEEQIRLTLSQGAKLVLGGRRNGAAVEATILRDVPHEADIMHDMEVFGPVIPVTAFENDEEAVALSNASAYGLGAAVFTQRIDLASKYAQQLEDGGVVINGSSYFRTFEMPFGGWKTSGLGNEGVSVTFEEMTKIKNVVLKGIIS